MIDVLDVLREALAPRYAVERLIGVGGMARVYLATEQRPHRRVAIKVMDPELSSRLSRERFVREVEVSSRLSHPLIVPVLAAGECRVDVESGGSAELCYYVMPYVDGESLRQRLLRETRVPLQDALHIASDVADALRYAHGQGVIHRDIKPENILLSGGHGLVADFGVARALSAAGGATLTGVGQQIGSPAYMSPEQLAGSGTVDQTSDIYSLGCVLYEMLAGEPPLLDLAETSTQERRSLDTALRGVPTGVARAVKDAISRALASLPHDRLPSASEFAAALPTTSHQTRGSGRVTPPRGRRRLALLAAAGLAVAGVVAALVVRPTPVASRPPAHPWRVVVAVLENHIGDPTLESLGHMAADWITQGISRTTRQEVLPSTGDFAAPQRGDEAGGGHLDLKEIGRKSGAGTIVAGVYYRVRDSIQFQVLIIEAASGHVIRALDPVSAPLGSPLGAVETLRRQVRGDARYAGPGEA
jgi:serine/threonine-protein kinase